MRRTWLLALVVAAVAVGVGWWFLRGETSAATPEEAVERASEDRRSPLLTGRAGAAVEVAAEARAASVVGTVWRAGRPVAARVEARAVAGGSPRDREMRSFETAGHVARYLSTGDASAPADAATTSDDDGRFALSGLAPGEHELRAVDGTLQGWARVHVPAAGAVVEQDVHLAEGGETVFGRARWSDGRPFLGTILAQPGNAHDDVAYEDVTRAVATATDAEGRFRCEGLPPGKIVLNAVLPGRWRVASFPIVLPLRGEYAFTVDADLGELRGRVVAAVDGRPVRGATVFASAWLPNTNDFVWARAETDAGGRFTVLLRADPATLLVDAAGFAPSVHEVSRPTGEFELRLHPPGRVEGRVLAEGGRGVAGVPVYAHVEGYGPATSVSDAEGRYAFPRLALGKATVLALGNGWSSKGMQVLWAGDALNPFERWIGPGESLSLDLDVVPCGRAEVRVLDAEGHGVEASIERRHDDGRNDEVTVPRITVATDAEGRALLDAFVPDQEAMLTVRAPGHPEAQQEVAVASGETKQVEVRLAPSRWVDVVVKGTDGPPLAGARVHVTVNEDDVVPEEPSNPVLLREWATDAEGRARVGPLPPGACWVSALALGRPPSGHVLVTGSADGAAKMSAVVLVAPGLTIDGRLIVPEGMRPESVILYANLEGNEYHEERVLADGSFHVDALAAGVVEMEATVRWEERSYQAKVSVPAGARDVVLRLESEGSEAEKRWRVRVLDPEGAPVHRATLRVYRRAVEGKKDVRTSDDESVSAGSAIAWIRPDESDQPAWLEVVDARDAAGRPTGWGPAVLGPVRPRDGDVELRFAPGESLAGRVEDEDGRPVAGLLVTATAVGVVGEGGPNVGRIHATVRSAPTGAFRLTGLADAEYRVVASTPFGTLEAPEQRVRPRGGDLVFRLRQSVRRTFTVRGVGGAPVEGADVSLRILDGHTGPTGRGRTDEHGSIVLGGLDPALDYVVLVQVDNAWSWFPDPKGDAVLALPRRRSLSGTVRDARGAGVLAAIQLSAGDWIVVGQTDDAGSFTVDLPEGTNRVRAIRAGKGESEPGPDVEATAGVVLLVPDE